MAIAGQYLYAVNNTYGGLTKIDLASGVSTLLNPSITGAVGADTGTVYVLSGTTLLAVDHTTGTARTVSSAVPTSGHTPTALLSVGGYLYYGQWSPGEVYPVLTRVYKADGSTAIIAASGFTNITGIGSDQNRSTSPTPPPAAR